MLIVIIVNNVPNPPLLVCWQPSCAGDISAFILYFLRLIYLGELCRQVGFIIQLLTTACTGSPINPAPSDAGR